jgi:hypothetical protein
MSCFMVLRRNLVSPDFAANDVISSESGTYPIDNAYNIEKRRKTWRTIGHWTVVTLENTIVFEETIAVPLTATITAGEYNSDTTFFAAIKAALEAVGGSTYTVSRDVVTNKIVITAVLGGGATIFSILWTDPGSADMADMLGYSVASDDTGSLVYTADLVRIHLNEWVEWDLGFPVNANAFIGLADRNKPLKMSPSAVIKIQANWTNSWNTPAVDLTCDYEDFILGKVDEAGLADQPYRYWRFYIEDKDNPYGYIELGTLFLCEALVLTRGAPVFPMEKPQEDRSVVAYSEGGQTIVGAGPKTQSFNLGWEGLDKDSFESLMEIYDEHGVHNSFFVVMDSQNAFSTKTIQSCVLVKFKEEPRPRLVSPGNWSMDWVVREEL